MEILQGLLDNLTALLAAHPLAGWLREFRPHRIPAKRYFGLDGGKQNEQL